MFMSHLPTKCENKHQKCELSSLFSSVRQNNQWIENNCKALQFVAFIQGKC